MGKIYSGLVRDGIEAMNKMQWNEMRVNHLSTRNKNYIFDSVFNSKMLLENYITNEKEELDE